MHNLGTFLLLLPSFPANSRQSVARFQQCEFNYFNLNNNRRELEETLTRQSEKLGGTEKGEEITSLGSFRLQEGVARLQLFKWSFNQFFVVNFPRPPPPSGRLLKYQMKDVFPPPINMSCNCPGNLQSRSAIPFNQSNFFGKRALQRSDRWRLKRKGTSIGIVQPVNHNIAVSSFLPHSSTFTHVIHVYLTSSSSSSS